MSSGVPNATAFFPLTALSSAGSDIVSQGGQQSLSGSVNGTARYFVQSLANETHRSSFVLLACVASVIRGVAAGYQMMSLDMSLTAPKSNITASYWTQSLWVSTPVLPNFPLLKLLLHTKSDMRELYLLLVQELKGHLQSTCGSNPTSLRTLEMHMHTCCLPWPTPHRVFQAVAMYTCQTLYS